MKHRPAATHVPTMLAWLLSSMATTSCRDTTVPEVPAPLGSLGELIASENSRPGDASWNAVSAPNSQTEIAAYLNSTSVSAGETLDLFAIAQDAAVQLSLYRIGWYGGAGARLIANYGRVAVPSSGQCTPAVPSPAECLWPVSAQLQVPADAPPGLYVLRYTNARGAGRFVPLIVKASQPVPVLVVLSFNTYQAYNSWAGGSFYKRLEGAVQTPRVSFLRPYADGTLRRHFFDLDLPLARFLERWDYPVGYVSDRDLHLDQGIGLGSRVVIFSGHSEYWSGRMRRHAERLRDAGVGLAFFGANDSYWKIRYEGEREGFHGTTLVCYKSWPDPLITDRARATGRFRDYPADWPENELIGIMHAGYTNSMRYVPLRVTDTSAAFFRGTGFQPNDSTNRVGGWEGDRIVPNGLTPSHLQVLFNAPYQSDDPGHSDVMQTTFYRAQSGAGVFAAGTVGWNLALDDLIPATADPRLQRFTRNLLDWYLLDPDVYRDVQGATGRDRP